jgi:hypothetical protein
MAIAYLCFPAHMWGIQFGLVGKKFKIEYCVQRYRRHWTKSASVQMNSYNLKI